jgi:uncharacterized membrane protein
MTCLNYIGEGLALFIKHGEKSSCYYDQNNQLRLVLDPVTIVELFDNAFTMLRHASCDNASVLLHMLQVIDTIAQEADSTRVIEELLGHVNLIQTESKAGSLIDADRERISDTCEKFRESYHLKLAELSA